MLLMAHSIGAIFLWFGAACIFFKPSESWKRYEESFGIMSNKTTGVILTLVGLLMIVGI